MLYDLNFRTLRLRQPAQAPSTNEAIGDLPPLLPRLSGRDVRPVVEALRAMKTMPW